VALWSQLLLFCVTEGMRDSDDKYPWLSEFICEYVDDTMHPDARAMFEEYLHADPSLQRYVGSLQSTRKMLRHHGCRLHAPCSLQQQLRARIAQEQGQQSGTDSGASTSTPTGSLLLMALVVVSLLSTGVLLSGYSFSPSSTPMALVQEPTWSPVLYRYQEPTSPQGSAFSFATTMASHDSLSFALFPRFSGEP